MLLVWVLAITFIAGVGGTGLGGAVSALIRRDSSRVVSLLLSFAGGVMLAVVCFSLISDALSSGDVGSTKFLLIVISGIALGYAVVWLLNIAIDKVTNHEIEHVDKDHPKTADDLDELIHSDHYAVHKQRSRQLFSAGVIMAAAIALHNLPEGMVIGAAYAGTEQMSVWSGAGLITAIIIGLHNVPEGMAVAVPLIAGGMSRGKAVLITALSGFPTVIGALIGFFLGSMGETWHALSLSFASGAMLYVVFGELLPEAILMWRSKLPAMATMAGLLLGLGLIYI